MQSRIVEEVNCLDDNGARVSVVKWQHYLSHTPLSGRVTWLEGSWEWMTRDGRDVNELPNGDFELIRTDGILRRID
jgi:hypothetical protein